MKQGIIRFWSRLPQQAKATLSGRLATADVTEEEILREIFDLRDRITARYRKPHETLLYNLGGVAAVELIRTIHGPAGTLSLAAPKAVPADFQIDVIAMASAREIDWKVFLNQVQVSSESGDEPATWVIKDRRRPKAVAV